MTQKTIAASLRQRIEEYFVWFCEDAIDSTAKKKSSATAGFQPNQKAGYPLIEKNGAVVVANSGASQGYPAGYTISPRKVFIFRPEELQ